MKGNVLFSILLYFLFSFLFPSFFSANAQLGILPDQSPNPVCQDQDNLTFTFNSLRDKAGTFTFVNGQHYTLGIVAQNEKYLTNAENTARNSPSLGVTIENKISSSSISFTVPLKAEYQINKINQWNYRLWIGGINSRPKNDESNVLYAGTYYLYPKSVCQTGLAALRMNERQFQAGTHPNLYIDNINPNQNYVVWFLGEKTAIANGTYPCEPLGENEVSSPVPVAVKGLGCRPKEILIKNLGDPGPKTICLKYGDTNFLNFGLDSCAARLGIQVILGVTPEGQSPITSNNTIIPREDPQAFTIIPTSPLPPCAVWVDINGTPFPTNTPENEIANIDDKKCVSVNTGLGTNISTEPAGFVKSLMSLILGVSGGIATLLIIVSGYKMIMSQGNAEALQGAREQLTAAIVGLLFIIFSLVILQVIGVDILHLPGFS